MSCRGVPHGRAPVAARRKPGKEVPHRPTARLRSPLQSTRIQASQRQLANIFGRASPSLRWSRWSTQAKVHVLMRRWQGSAWFADQCRMEIQRPWIGAGEDTNQQPAFPRRKWALDAEETKHVQSPSEAIALDATTREQLLEMSSHFYWKDSCYEHTAWETERRSQKTIQRDLIERARFRLVDSVCSPFLLTLIALEQLCE